jgi:hypothetical protein
VGSSPLLLLLLFTGATTLCGSWPLPWPSCIGSAGFVKVDFSGMRLLSPRPIPQPRGPESTLFLAPTVWPVIEINLKNVKEIGEYE